MSKAILLSGGIDSIALAYWQKPAIAFTLNYGQAPAEAEIRASSVVAKALNIGHYILQIDCSSLGSGDLLNQEALDVSPSSEWWPYRNQMLITLAAMKAISLGVTELMTASVKSDGFHKDGTRKFYTLMNDLVAYQEGAMKISSPAIDMTSVELVRHSQVPNNILYWAHSCHTANVPCGYCRGCNKYRQVMHELQSKSQNG
jgi:7-cyano-7-deazaguanine synthase